MEPASASPLRLTSRPDYARGAAQSLANLPGLVDIEAAWQAFGAILEDLRRADTRELSSTEAEVEALAQATAGQRHRIPPLGRMLAERLGDDIRDCWARLIARDLIVRLRSDGATLRSITDGVHVSTPYLSQLANGTGPVPSEKILARLTSGIKDAGLDPPERLRPDEFLEPLIARIRQLRQDLRTLALTRPQPKIQIEGLGPKEERRIRPLIEGVLLRCLDDAEGEAVSALLEELASADSERREALSLVANSNDVAAIVGLLSNLDDKARRALLTLLQGVAPDAGPQAPIEPRRPKAPLIRRSDG